MARKKGKVREVQRLAAAQDQFLKRMRRGETPGKVITDLLGPHPVTTGEVTEEEYSCSIRMCGHKLGQHIVPPKNIG